INLQVLEREGWYHSLPMDAGVLQEVRGRAVRESNFARQFANPKTTVLPVESAQQEAGTGPGARVRSKLVIWVPVLHQGEVIGSVAYHTYRKRRVPTVELQFLKDVHRRLGVLLANASLNELTRNQARRLEALNSIARAMTSTLDETSVLTGLYGTLRELLPVDALEMITLQDGADRARYLHMEGDAVLTSRSLPARSPLAATARDVVGENKRVLVHHPHSSLWVPLAEGYQYVGGVEEVMPPVALAVTGPSREAYETSKPVLVRKSPWARSFEGKTLEREVWTVGQGAAVFVSGPPSDQRRVSRSFVWVPVLSGERITAMLSLQSYTEGAFDDWHVKPLQDVAAHVSLALANADHFA